MGLNADAELVWGIPVLAYDDDTGEPTPFWSEDDEDWTELPGELEVRQYGHYEDPDNHRGILTSTRVKPFMADCWNPRRLSDFDLVVSDKVLSKSQDQMRAFAHNEGIEQPADFYDGGAAWWLVADYG